jgi:hypothetical protein
MRCAGDQSGDRVSSDGLGGAPEEAPVGVGRGAVPPVAQLEVGRLPGQGFQGLGGVLLALRRETEKLEKGEGFEGLGGVAFALRRGVGKLFGGESGGVCVFNESFLGGWSFGTGRSQPL